MAISFNAYYEKLELMQRWMVTDLRQAQIQGYANFLVAMGIFNYLEILGSFYSTATKSREGFKSVFYDLLPNENNQYKNIYDQLDKLTGYDKNQGGAYDCLRCGLTHEYLVKTYSNKKVKNKISFTVYGADNPASFGMNIASRNCGLEIITLQLNTYHLRIYNPRLINDLNLSFENFKEKIRSNKNTKTIFMARAKEVGLENLN